jgi:hypothetical protein
MEASLMNGKGGEIKIITKSDMEGGEEEKIMKDK